LKKIVTSVDFTSLIRLIAEKKGNEHMSAPSTAPCEAIWLELHNYRVLPVGPQLDECGNLREAINRGVPACPDSHRADFYDLELDDGWAYIHVRNDLRVVYLVSYLGRGNGSWLGRSPYSPGRKEQE
jgi:hypothetical protein